MGHPSDSHKNTDVPILGPFLVLRIRLSRRITAPIVAKVEKDDRLI